MAATMAHMTEVAGVQVRFFHDPEVVTIPNLLLTDQEEEEQFGPLLIGVLEQHGISATDVKKLQVSLCFFSSLTSYTPTGVWLLHSGECRLRPQEETVRHQGNQ